MISIEGVRTMLLHCAKPGDSGTYRMTITNSSGTASCSASLSVRSESQSFVVVFLKKLSLQERRPRTHQHRPHLIFLCRGVPTQAWAGPAPPPTPPPRQAPTPPPTPPTTPPTPLAEALSLIPPIAPTFRQSLLLQLLPQ